MSESKTVTASIAENKPAKKKRRQNKGFPAGVYNNFGFELFNAVFWQSLGSPLILFIRQSGGSAFIIGLTSAFPLLLMPFALFGYRFVEKLGYRRTAMTFWTARWIFSSMLILVAMVDFSGAPGLQAGLAVAVLVIYHFCRNFGMSGYLPWLTAILPARTRGLYLSRATVFSNLGGIATYLAIGAILGSNPALSTFALVFAIGTFGGLCSSVFMARIEKPKIAPRPNTPQAKESFWGGMKRCFTIPGFKTFVVIQSFYGVAFFGIPSLSLIYLREKVGINPGLILYFSTAGIVGAAFASTVWGRWIDRRQSAISLQLIAFLGLSLNSIFWLLLQVVPSGFEYFLAALIMLLNATWIGALNMSQTHTIMTLAPEDGRVLFQNIATFLTYCSQALAPMLWGLFLDFFDQRKLKLDLGFYQLGTYQIFFAATLFIGLAGAVYIYRVVRKIPVE